MKATGIVRRIDELGRVVIPKEIRRTQRIRRGDPLEIFTTGDGEVIFKKVFPHWRNERSGSPVHRGAEQKLCAYHLCGRPGPHPHGERERPAGAGRPQHQPAAGKADGWPQTVPVRGRCRKMHPALRGLAPVVLCAAPIIASGDVIGVVGLLTEDRTAVPDAAQLKAVNVAAAFLARQMEE